MTLRVRLELGSDDNRGREIGKVGVTGSVATASGTGSGVVSLIVTVDSLFSTSIRVGSSSFRTVPSAAAATLAANSAATQLADLAGFSGSGAVVKLAEFCSNVEAGGTTGLDLEVSTETSCLVLGSMIAIRFLVRFRVFCSEGGREGIV